VVVTQITSIATTIYIIILIIYTRRRISGGLRVYENDKKRRVRKGESYNDEGRQGL